MFWKQVRITRRGDGIAQPMVVGLANSEALVMPKHGREKVIWLAGPLECPVDVRLKYIGLTC